jgi:hypothetical protein
MLPRRQIARLASDRQVLDRGRQPHGRRVDVEVITVEPFIAAVQVTPGAKESRAR